MENIDATELKTNFKVYAGKAAAGEVICIKRPKKEDDILLVNKTRYDQAMRLLEYFARLQGFDGVDKFIEKNSIPRREVVKVDVDDQTECVIFLNWDDEANVWYASSDDVPGLVMESGSMDALIEKVKNVIPELLELTGKRNISSIFFKSERRQAVVAYG